MITGGFIVGYEMFSWGKFYRVKHPLGLQYLRDEAGRIHPNLTEWVWGADMSKVIGVEKTKVATISDANPSLKGMFVQYNGQLVVAKVIAQRIAQQAETGTNSEEPVENQRFPGEVGLTEEEQIMRIMAYKEFANPTLH